VICKIRFHGGRKKFWEQKEWLCFEHYFKMAESFDIDGIIERLIEVKDFRPGR
jgi:hypothetical protein